MLTRKMIESKYKQAVLRLDIRYHYLKAEFGDDIAKQVYAHEMDKITNMYQLRLQGLNKRR